MRRLSVLLLFAGSLLTVDLLCVQLRSLTRDVFPQIPRLSYQTSTTCKDGKNSSPVLQDSFLQEDGGFRDLGLATRGSGWEMWNRSGILAQDSVTCTWTRYRPKLAQLRKTNNTHLMCIYPTNEDNYVSGSVRSSGRWGDCAGIVDLWMKYNGTKQTDYYFDIGANIGTCVMEMLLTTDARIVAFEPEPRNLAQLTATLMSMPASYRDRVALFPVALGSSSYTSYVHQAKNNRGHTMVGDKFAPESRGQTSMPPFHIHVEPLDSIIKESKTSSRLFIKMDVQGFECNAMDGGRRTFQQARVLKTEQEVDKLMAQNCSAKGLKDRIARAGLQLTATRQASDIIALGKEAREG